MEDRLLARATNAACYGRIGPVQRAQHVDLTKAYLRTVALRNHGTEVNHDLGGVGDLFTNFGLQRWIWDVGIKRNGCRAI